MMIKKLLGSFYKKELVFILFALCIGYLITNPCLERSDDTTMGATGYACDIRAHGSMSEILIESAGVWFLLKIGQWLGQKIEQSNSFLYSRRRFPSNRTLSKKEIIILGETIDKENFPKLYKWAKDNPETLESQLKSIAKAWHEGSIRSAIVALESDMEHG